MPAISQIPLVTTLTGQEIVPMDQGIPDNPLTVAATTSTIVQHLNPGYNNFGYLNVPINPHSDNYTLLQPDAGCALLHPLGAGGGHTFSIPANVSIALPLGTTFTFVNRDSNALSIAVLTDTLILCNTTTTGTRTLAQNGMATCLKVETTVWIITGVGLT